MNHEESQNLKQRVNKAKSDLVKIGIVKSPRYYFCLKYPEFQEGEELDNLWYARKADEKFTICLEAFVTFKQNQYE